MRRCAAVYASFATSRLEASGAAPSGSVRPAVRSLEAGVWVTAFRALVLTPVADS